MKFNGLYQTAFSESETVPKSLSYEQIILFEPHSDHKSQKWSLRLNLFVAYSSLQLCI